MVLCLMIGKIYLGGRIHSICSRGFGKDGKYTYAGYAI